MGLVDRVIETIQSRRDNLLTGNINCIPFPFIRFRSQIPGIEQGRYTICTGATKSAKTQLATYIYVFYPILYSYKHPNQAKVTVLYYPQEETPEQITLKFMSYLLYFLSKGKYRVSPTDLNSTNNDKPLSEEVIKILQCPTFQKIFKHFEENVIFSAVSNPTGVWKECKKYAEEHGKVYTKEAKYTDEFGITKTTQGAFDYYEPDNPKEYKIIFYDHASLVATEGNKTLRETMAKLSEYFVLLRNRYGFTPVLVQQQAMFENLDAYKMNMLKPTIANLADNKATSRDVDVCISIFSPYKYNLKTWEWGGEEYDITKLKDNIRFMECLLNRHGQSNGVLPLYFDGACNLFTQMPKPSDTVGMESVYKQIEAIRNQKTEKVFFTCICRKDCINNLINN